MKPVPADIMAALRVLAAYEVPPTDTLALVRFHARSAIAEEEERIAAATPRACPLCGVVAVIAGHLAPCGAPCEAGSFRGGEQTCHYATWCTSTGCAGGMVHP